MPKKHCHLDSCDILKFDLESNGDCILQHAFVVKRELEKLVNHANAMNEKMEKVMSDRDKLEKKYRELKEKRRSPTTDKSGTMKKARHDSTLKGTSSNMFDNDSDTQDKLFKSKDTKLPAVVFGKENSPKKKKPANEFVPTKHLPYSSPSRPLRQQTLSFISLKPAELSKFENRIGKETKGKLQNLSKPGTSRKSSGSGKISKRSESSLRRAVTDASLFAFLPPKKHTPPKSNHFETDKDPDETPEISQLMLIKQEKVSELNINSDADMFPSDLESSAGSSVAWIENDDQSNQVITVIDSTENHDECLFHEHGRNFIDCSESEASIQKPPRRRVRVYGDCKDCNEYYDRYAGINGATEAEEFIHPCSKKCKGYWFRVQRAKPPLKHPNKPPIPINSDNPTPEGFWDIPFTVALSDPDKTIDGL